MEIGGIGRTFAGRYRLDREAGRGGSATVYLGQDLKHDRPVAIKVLDPDLAATVGVERFLREIQTIANLQHPHILGLIDSGTADGATYYVMPFVEGESLRDRLSREKQLPIAEAVRIGREVAAAVDYAHRHGVIHRDLKPENILLHDGQALVADFGIALAIATSSNETRMTEAGVTIGTPTYMSPEQAMGAREITARSDVYALGTVVYEMLLGEPPFTGPTAQSVVAKLLTEKPAALSVRRDTVPAAVEAAVLTALQKLPADRFATAAEFGAALGDSATRPLTASNTTFTRTLTTGTFTITEDTCRRLSRAGFDPRLIGSAMSYLDNGVSSDVLVCYIAACGRGGDQFTQILHETPFRGIAPTFRGFEAGTGWRPALSIDDHIILVRELLRDVASRLSPRVVIMAGFSSGGDFSIRFAAAPDPDARLRLDGCLTLGANLSAGTCFLTSALAALGGNNDDAMLATLRDVSAGAATLDEWVNVCEYVTAIVPVFRHDIAPLRTFAAGISAPFAKESIDPFAAWYRAAAERGCRLRCVFEDTDMYRDLVRQLQIRNFDERLLGERYEAQSVLNEAGTTHFDLIKPSMVARHLDALAGLIRQPTANRRNT